MRQARLPEGQGILCHRRFSEPGTSPIVLVNLTHAALWLGAIALMVVGFMATVVPGLPGVLVIYGGMWLAAWIDDFTKLGGRR